MQRSSSRPALRDDVPPSSLSLPPAATLPGWSGGGSGFNLPVRTFAPLLLRRPPNRTRDLEGDAHAALEVWREERQRSRDIVGAPAHWMNRHQAGHRRAGLARRSSSRRSRSTPPQRTRRPAGERIDVRPATRRRERHQPRRSRPGWRPGSRAIHASCTVPSARSNRPSAGVRDVENSRG